MTRGQRLHEYDLQLCEYVRSNIRGHFDNPAFQRYVRQAVQARPPLLAYLFDEAPNDQPFLLSDRELDYLELALEGPAEVMLPWVPYRELHQQRIDCVREISTELTRQVAEEWSVTSTGFAEQLEHTPLTLPRGISIVYEWVDVARRLLRALGATQFLPRPDGMFPTPSHPEPPPAASPNADQPAEPERPTGGALMTAVGEILDLLRTQRTIKDFYTTTEIAELLGKAEFTVREWCRHGRVRGQKQGSGRGKHQAWVIAHEELLRIQKEGLLPTPSR